MMNGPDI